MCDSNEYMACHSCMMVCIVGSGNVGSRSRRARVTQQKSICMYIFKYNQILAFNGIHLLISITETAELLLASGVPHIELNRTEVGKELQGVHFDT